MIPAIVRYGIATDIAACVQAFGNKVRLLVLLPHGAKSPHPAHMLLTLNLALNNLK